MPVTAPTDVADWVPQVISTALYDEALDSDYALTSLAETYPDLEGKPGEQFKIPTLHQRTPADNLAVTTPAVDDKLSGGGVTITIKEAVKSHAFYDRDQYATGTDFNTLAGQAVGDAINQRIELDLAAALYAGRRVFTDPDGGGPQTVPVQTATGISIVTIRAMKKLIPAGMRKRGGGPVIVADVDTLDTLHDDPAVNNAAAFGSSDSIESGDFIRPIAGVRLRPVDDDVLPKQNGNKIAVCFLPKLLARAVQKAPGTEPERDARARLSRIVGTMLHGEGVVDSRGVIVFEITG